MTEPAQSADTSADASATPRRSRACRLRREDAESSDDEYDDDDDGEDGDDDTAAVLDARRLEFAGDMLGDRERRSGEASLLPGVVGRGGREAMFLFFFSFLFSFFILSPVVGWLTAKSMAINRNVSDAAPYVIIRTAYRRETAEVSNVGIGTDSEGGLAGIKV